MSSAGQQDGTGRARLSLPGLSCPARSFRGPAGGRRVRVHACAHVCTPVCTGDWGSLQGSGPRQVRRASRGGASPRGSRAESGHPGSSRETGAEVRLASLEPLPLPGRGGRRESRRRGITAAPVLRGPLWPEVCPRAGRSLCGFWSVGSFIPRLWHASGGPGAGLVMCRSPAERSQPGAPTTPWAPTGMAGRPAVGTWGSAPRGDASAVFCPPGAATSRSPLPGAGRGPHPLVRQRHHDH